MPPILTANQRAFATALQQPTGPVPTLMDQIMGLPLGPIGAIGGGIFSIFGAMLQNKAIAQAAKMNIEARQRVKVQAQVQRTMEMDRLANELHQVVGRARVHLGPIQGTKAQALANIYSQGARSQVAIDARRDQVIEQMTQEQKLIAAGANSRMSIPILDGFKGSLAGFAMLSQIQGLHAQKQTLAAAHKQAMERHELFKEASALEIAAKQAVIDGYQAELKHSAGLQEAANNTNRGLENIAATRNQALAGPVAQTNPAVFFKAFYTPRFFR